MTEPYGDLDVVVVGGGAAGSTAAIAAARGGARTLVIDALPFLGGTSTAVLDTFYGFYTPGARSVLVVAGIAGDVVAGLRALGPVVERPNTYGAGTGITYVPDHLKVVWEQLVTAAGARVLLHATVVGAEVEDGRLASIVVATRAGLRTVRASVFVDASGDADLCHHAGFAYELAGAEAPAQTATTTFRMVNVDMAARRSVAKDELHALMAAAAMDGYDLPRREGSDHVTPVDGMTATIMTRLDQVRRDDDGGVRNASDPDVLTELEVAGRRQALEYVRFLVDRVPGYANASLAALGTRVGVRETRRVHGDYRVTGEDVLAARQFDDQIGLCGAPIEDHHGGGGDGTTWRYLPDGRAVGIPLRSLIVRDATNVLVAGRCFSATHEAHASIRSMAQCMAMGQAVGTVAAMAATDRDATDLAATAVPPSTRGDVRAVPLRAILARLHADGAILSLSRPVEAAS